MGLEVEDNRVYSVAILNFGDTIVCKSVLKETLFLNKVVYFPMDTQ
jgi:hypothetical protein